MHLKRFIQIIAAGFVSLAVSNCSNVNPVNSVDNGATKQAYYSNGSFPVAVTTNYTGDLMCLTTAMYNGNYRLYQAAQSSNYSWPVSFSLNSSILTGIPSALRFKDTLYIFNYGTDQKVWYSKVNAQNPNGSLWTTIGSRVFSNTYLGIIGLARFGNSISSPIVVFARDNAGYLYATQQNSNGTFSGTWTLLTSGFTINRSFAVMTQPNNQIVVAASQVSDFKVTHTTMSSVTSFAPWAVINSANGPMVVDPYANNDIIIGKNADGHLEIYASSAFTSQGNYSGYGLYHCWQNSPNTDVWSAWSSYFYSGQTSLILVQGQLAVANNPDGRQELFFRDESDGSMYLKHIYQTVANGIWSTVQTFNAGSFVPGNNIAAGNYRDGRIFVVGWASPANSRKYVAQTVPNGSWNAVGTIGGLPN